MIFYTLQNGFQDNEKSVITSKKQAQQIIF
jgi:hypothetical protein